MKKCERKRAAVVLCGISAAIFLSQMWGSETSQTVERKALPQNMVMDQQRLGYYEQKVETSMDLENTISIQENDSTAEEIETTIPQEKSLVGTSYEIDQQINAELEKGHTWEEPMVILNPYQISPLSAYILFNTQEECAVRVTVRGKTEAADICLEVEKATSHRVPVIGLYPDMENTVSVELLDENGNVTDSMELKLQTDALPESLLDVVEPVESSGSSAFGLTMVYGQQTFQPFAYDCMGDVRWYLTRSVASSGVFTLSNDRFIFQDDLAYVPSTSKPQVTNLCESDYLGRVYKLYYVAGGTHHEVIEKEPGGNLLVLTSTALSHIEDKVEEIDRQTGEVVNELYLQDILDCKYVNKIDWAHLNTVSYQPEEDTIIISPRNLESVIKLNWTTKEIQWILCDPRFWENTGYEQYVLQPESDFVYHFQQHAAYQLGTDLDGNTDTKEILMFDNHSVKVRQDDLPYYEKTGESYVLVYAVNEEEKTVQQIKKIPTIWSTITSSSIYDEESNHIFGMCGTLEKSAERRGMVYEFDYDTEEILNQYSIKTTFYRASEMKIDANDLAAPMTVDENYIAGELWQPVELEERAELEEVGRNIGAEELELHITGQVLYAGTLDHHISQIIFQGEDHTFVYDLSQIPLHGEEYLSFYECIPVPLQGLAADEYEVYVVYENELCDTEQQIVIAGSEQ